MQKILFISNISNKITNFSIPSIKAAQELDYEFHMAANYSSFVDEENQYNVKIHHIDIRRNPFSIKNIIAYKQLLTLIKKEKIDVIHCNTPIGGILGRLCGNKSKVKKIIYTAHGFHFYKGAPAFKSSIFKIAEKWLARYTDAIITINQEDYKAAKKFKLKKNGNVYYIPGVGVNTEEYQEVKLNPEISRSNLGFKKEDTILIAMGDLIVRKNYSASIKAIAKTSNPRIHFLICGVGTEMNNLKSLAKKLGIEKQIHFLGFRKDIKELLRIADIFLFTTLQEGLPRSMMEAMASGLPCIASDIRGNTDLIENGKGGYLFNPEDIEGFAKAISILAVDDNLKEKMSNINLENIKTFDISNIKKEMKKIYEKELLRE